MYFVPGFCASHDSTWNVTGVLDLLKLLYFLNYTRLLNFTGDLHSKIKEKFICIYLESLVISQAKNGMKQIQRTLNIAS